MLGNIKSKVKLMIKTIVGIDGNISPKPGDRLIELGINSINYVQLLVNIEFEYGIKFDIQNLVLDKKQTFKEFVLFIKGYLHSKGK